MAALEGESILITGGASGLGRGVAERFLEEGAKVAIVDRSQDKLSAWKGVAPDRLLLVPGDVRSLSDMESAVAACVERFGKLDCVVGNAGIWDFMTSLDALEPEQFDASFDEIFHVNVKGYMTLAKASLPHLVRSKGSMILTVSNAGFDPNGGGPLYTASKHAIVGLIRQLAFEFAPEVRVNGVAPGPIETDLRGPSALGLQDTAIANIGITELATPALPLGIVPSAAEYASAYVFYASRRDNVPATGGILKCEAGIGVRGIGMVSGGTELANKYAS